MLVEGFLVELPALVLMHMRFVTYTFYEFDGFFPYINPLNGNFLQVALKLEHRNSKGCNYGPPYEWQVYKYVAHPAIFFFVETFFLTIGIVCQHSQWLLWHTIGPLQGSSGRLLYTCEFTSYYSISLQLNSFYSLIFLGNGYAWSQPLGRVEFNGAGVSIFHSFYDIFCHSSAFRLNGPTIVNRMTSRCVHSFCSSTILTIYCLSWLLYNEQLDC